MQQQPHNDNSLVLDVITHKQTWIFTFISACLVHNGDKIIDAQPDDLCCSSHFFDLSAFDKGDVVEW